MTLFGRCKRHERVKHFRMHFRIGPVLRNAGPFDAQAFPIGIGILDDKCSKPIRMRRDYAKADRPAVVMKVEGVSVAYDDVGGASLCRILENPVLSDDSVLRAKG